MIYILFVLIAAVSVMGVCIYGMRRGVIEIGKLKLYKPCEDDVSPFQKTSLILLIMICFLAAMAVQISLYKNTSTISFVKLYGLFVIVVAAATVDAKCRIIPNALIVTGLLFRAAVYGWEILAGEELKTVIFNDLLGLGIGFVFLAVVSLLSKGALGFGDAKLFGVIGLISGSFCTYSTLLVSLVVSLLVSVINIARKRMGRKDSFPFGPCIAIGYTVAILLSSY